MRKTLSIIIAVILICTMAAGCAPYNRNNTNGTGRGNDIVEPVPGVGTTPGVRTNTGDGMGNSAADTNRNGGVTTAPNTGNAIVNDRAITPGTVIPGIDGRNEVIGAEADTSLPGQQVK